MEANQEATERAEWLTSPLPSVPTPRWLPLSFLFVPSLSPPPFSLFVPGRDSGWSCRSALSLPQEPSSFGPERCRSSLSLSWLLLNSLCLLLLAIAYAIPIALETRVVQAGEAHDADFINSTLYCPFTLRGLAWRAREGSLCTFVVPVPQCRPASPVFQSFHRPGPWKRGMLRPVSQLGR